MAADWSMLPSDTLGVIAMKFTIAEDFIRFSAVCQGWNRAPSLVKHQWRPSLPWLLLAENPNENSDVLRKIINYNNNQIFSLKLTDTFRTRCSGSAYGWAAMVDESSNVQLFNPITNARIHFPSLKSLTHNARENYDSFRDEYMFSNVYLTKLIVLKVSQNDTDEFVIMVIYNNYHHVDFARHGDESWTSVPTKKFTVDPTGTLLTKMVDIVAKNDHIFALYGDGSIVHWHASEFCSGELLIPTDYSPPGTYEMVSRRITAHISKYLVESQGDLIMVVRFVEGIISEDFALDIEFDPDIGYWKTAFPIYQHNGKHNRSEKIEFLTNVPCFVCPNNCSIAPPDIASDVGYRTFAFDVFKLSERKRWEKIEDLGNVALFIGANYSMSISLVDQCLQRNCIYFTDDLFMSWPLVKEFGGHDTGFYDMKRDEIEFLKYDDMRPVLCRSSWFVPGF